jgi:hypothetical protein
MALTIRVTQTIISQEFAGGITEAATREVKSSLRQGELNNGRRYFE